MSIVSTPTDSTAGFLPLAGGNSLASLLHELGDVPLRRVRRFPAPGTATVADVDRIHVEEGHLCELIDGVLVEKAVEFKGSVLACAFVACFRAYSKAMKPGIVAGEAGLLQLVPGLVRGPDAAFTLKERLPGGKLPGDAVPLLVPDVVVEVMSQSNTRGEMERKLGEYLSAG